MPKQLCIISNGDARQAADEVCWPMQQEQLDLIEATARKICPDIEIRRLPEYSEVRRHGFLMSQQDGARAMSRLTGDEYVMALLTCWAYSHHLSGPLQSFPGTRIALCGNFSGTWPGLVALLNLSGTLTRLDVEHERLWSESFTSARFMNELSAWLNDVSVACTRDESHVHEVDMTAIPEAKRLVGSVVSKSILKDRRIIGQFDVGCMGMLNGVLDPALVGALGMPLEYLSQSDLLAEMTLVSDDEAHQHLEWLRNRGTKFDCDWDHDTESRPMFSEPEEHDRLTVGQLLWQMKMYAAAVRLVERYNLAAIGIPYQIGMVRCVPASDLVEGMLNNKRRPPVVSPETNEIIRQELPITHYNEGDLGSGIPQLLMNEILRHLEMPSETTLHDVRWGREYNGDFVWVLLISGGAPPAHWNGWENTRVYRQPKMYFQLGGGTCSGVSKPGVITWARVFQKDGILNMHCGLGDVIKMPDDEVQERLNLTTKVWPIMNARLRGIGRDQLMGTHMSNHITVCYGDILGELVSTAEKIGLNTVIIGENPFAT